jgi:hypothetical protein
MRRISIVAIIGLFVLVVAGQFVAPRIAAHEVAKRLTKDGGSATASVHAFPWLRLLFNEGDSVRVRANGIRLPLITPGSKVLSGIDGFDDVDIEATNAAAGPFKIQKLTMQRSGGNNAYRTTLTGTTTGRAVATFAGNQAGGALGGFLTGLAGGALPFGDQTVPFDFDTTLRSVGGMPQAVAVTGNVAGFPAGPLAEALAQALAGRF